jgi:A/G-specific adenine glycosylase
MVQALMDLGATVCRPTTPRCGECPLRASCAAFATGEPERFPDKAKRAERPRKFGVAWWIERDRRVWLVRRPPSGLLGGMAALPGSEWSEAAVTRPDAIGIVRHVFTHFALELHLVPRGEPRGEGWWQPLDRLDEAGLPTLYRKAADLALAGRDRLAA